MDLLTQLKLKLNSNGVEAEIVDVNTLSSTSGDYLLNPYVEDEDGGVEDDAQHTQEDEVDCADAIHLR